MAATPNALTADDLDHLRRCVELAREAVAAGDEPFGSVLVSAEGLRLAEDRNRARSIDPTRHPEFELARWAAVELEVETRAGATVYTSGEHCAMCSAAHAWVGLRRIVYAVSGAQLVSWAAEWGEPGSPVLPLPVHAVAPGVVVQGPAPELADELRALHRHHFDLHRHH